LGRNYSNVILEIMGSGNFGRIDFVILGKAFIYRIIYLSKKINQIFRDIVLGK
tara:strand:+ start:828 stop:986 length:159 start_codon:yes stop_codon:yes gene_type:complete